MQEVWDSFEWLFREKLESLDNMTRQMIREMQMSGARIEDIRKFIPKAFAELWRRVADEKEGETE